MHYSEVSDTIEDTRIDDVLATVIHNRTCLKCGKKYKIMFDWRKK